jgi:hypothetical protein
MLKVEIKATVSRSIGCVSNMQQHLFHSSSLNPETPIENRCHRFLTLLFSFFTNSVSGEGKRTNERTLARPKDQKTDRHRLWGKRAAGYCSSGWPPKKKKSFFGRPFPTTAFCKKQKLGNSTNSKSVNVETLSQQCSTSWRGSQKRYHYGRYYLCVLERKPTRAAAAAVVRRQL